MEMVRTLSEEVASLAHKADIYSNYQDHFEDSQHQIHSFNLEEIAQIVLSEIADIECDLTLRKILWEAQEEWGTLFWEWRKCSLQTIDVDLVQRSVSKWLHIIHVLEKGKSMFLEFSHPSRITLKMGSEQQDHCPWFFHPFSEAGETGSTGDLVGVVC
jgi:hypothetical protein